MAAEPLETTDKPIQLLKLEQLKFDPINPRFSRYFGQDDQPEETVIERMITVENVQELMGSIGEQDYFEGEPLLVAKPAADSPDPRFIVVEGNRRLAALKLLSGQIAANELPSITSLREQSEFKPKEVPCIVFESRRDILRYLGYRHITGPKKWDSLSKARYIKQLKETFFAELGVEDQNRAIAKEIGSKPHYVAQMLTGLTVFNRAKDANFYGLQRISEEDVDFGVLTTALSYTEISNYIGLETPRDITAENLNSDNTRDLLNWVYSQNEDGFTVLGESRNLKYLAATLAVPSAVVRLKEKGDLREAYLFSEGPAVAFTKVLNDAENKLRSAYELAPDISVIIESHLVQLGRILNLAEDIQSSVRRAMRKQREAEESANG